MKLALSCFELTLLTLYFTKFCMNKVMIMEKKRKIRIKSFHLLQACNYGEKCEKFRIFLELRDR